MNKSAILLALDGMSVNQAKAIASVLAPHVAGGKANDLIDEGGAAVLDDMDFRVRFLDPKINDIKNTVGNRVAKYAKHAELLTLHASMSFGALRLAAQKAKELRIKSIAVTVLTDINREQCRTIFGGPPLARVVDFASRARRAGFDGIVCSPREVGHVRRLWEEALIVVPGVRSEGESLNDQKRTGTPYQAILDGASYLVCGRQILSKPTIEAQIAEAVRINDEVERARSHLAR